MTAAWTRRTTDSTMNLTASLAERKDIALAAKTLGLVGVNNEAIALAKQAQSDFGVSVMVFAPVFIHQAELDALDATICPTLGDLLALSDVISLHCPARPSRAVIGGLELGAMREHALLVNANPTDLIDQTALAHALWFNTIGGAGLVTDNVIPELAGCDDLIVFPTTSDHSHVALCA